MEDFVSYGKSDTKSQFSKGFLCGRRDDANRWMKRCWLVDKGKTGCGQLTRNNDTNDSKMNDSLRMA